MEQLSARELAQRLGQQAEAVCRRYLSSGRRQGNYWLVGDVHNTPGCSMFVRLHDGDQSKAGKWSDAATGEHGDLLDIIGISLGHAEFSDTMSEAQRFLALPETQRNRSAVVRHRYRKPALNQQSQLSARRLWRMARPIAGTPAETYLRQRGLTRLREPQSLRFLDDCYWQPEGGGATQSWPALIAAVTDVDGRLTGVHRSWLARDGRAKAPIDPPRKALGKLLGHAVRFGESGPVMAAGEGIETTLSLRQLAPRLPLLAALSAAHLAAIRFPDILRRLYVVQDRDEAGAWTVKRLRTRAAEAGIELRVLLPHRRDLNDDLLADGEDVLRARIGAQLHPSDVPLLQSSPDS